MKGERRSERVKFVRADNKGIVEVIQSERERDRERKRNKKRSKYDANYWNLVAWPNGVGNSNLHMVHRFACDFCFLMLIWVMLLLLFITKSTTWEFLKSQYDRNNSIIFLFVCTKPVTAYQRKRRTTTSRKKIMTLGM